MYSFVFVSRQAVLLELWMVAVGTYLGAREMRWHSYGRAMDGDGVRGGYHYSTASCTVLDGSLAASDYMIESTLDD